MENWPRHTKTGRRSRRRTERGGTVREQGERAARPGPCPRKTKRCGPQGAAASCLAVGLPFAGLAGRLQHPGRTARAEGRAATAESGHVWGGIVLSGGFRLSSLRGWVGLWLARLRQRSAERRRSTALRVGWGGGGCGETVPLNRGRKTSPPRRVIARGMRRAWPGGL